MWYARSKMSHKAFPMRRKFGYAAAVIRWEICTDLHNAAAAGIHVAEKLDQAWEFTYVPYTTSTL